MHVAQRLQKLCTLDCNFHWEPASPPMKRTLKSGAAASRRSRNAKPDGKGAAPAQKSQECGGLRGLYPQVRDRLISCDPGRSAPLRCARDARPSLFLQLPLQDLDFLGQRHVITDQTFDLA